MRPRNHPPPAGSVHRSRLREARGSRRREGLQREKHRGLGPYRTLLSDVERKWEPITVKKIERGPHHDNLTITIDAADGIQFASDALRIRWAERVQFPNRCQARPTIAHIVTCRSVQPASGGVFAAVSFLVSRS